MVNALQAWWLPLANVERTTLNSWFFSFWSKCTYGFWIYDINRSIRRKKRWKSKHDPNKIAAQIKNNLNWNLLLPFCTVLKIVKYCKNKCIELSEDVPEFAENPVSWWHQFLHESSHKTNLIQSGTVAGFSGLHWSRCNPKPGSFTFLSQTSKASSNV